MVQSKRPIDNEMPTALKRRKVRRGTQNCWECRRRKIRCTYAVPTDSVCDGCKSRRLRCISQIFSEVTAEGTEAIAQAENLRRSTTEEEVLTRESAPTGLRSLKPRTRRPIQPNTTPVQAVRGLSLSEGRGDAPLSGPEVTGRSGETRRILLAAWPSHPDLEAILSVAASRCLLFHGVVCTPYTNVLIEDMSDARELLQLPPDDAHPVLLARKVLLLAGYMQDIPRESLSHLGTFGSRYFETMTRLVDAARRVTSDDSLVGSPEGIECIMLEAMYYNNGGKLRQAWTTHRRAMTMAQIIGIHRGPYTTIRLPVHDLQSRRRIDPEHMWCRLVITDRYLSLVLGLPQCSAESLPEVSGALNPSTLLERLERLHCTIGGLIMQRNRSDMRDLAKTQQIDRLLQEAAALMPARWWLPPDIHPMTADGGSQGLGETLRRMMQLTHYHLLAQLHLPYLLHPSGKDSQYDYSKITTVLASREILSRFVSFRGSSSAKVYCRGVDFLVFVASTVLSLAHIDSNCQQAQARTDVHGAGTPCFLKHQRMSDRGLLEQTLQSMEEMCQGGPDEDSLAWGIADVLRQLLGIESKAAGGAFYTTSVTGQPGEPGEPGGTETGSDGNTANSDETLGIRIPYFGTIKFHLGYGLRAEHRLLELEQPLLTRSLSLQNSGDHYTEPIRGVSGRGRSGAEHFDVTQAASIGDTTLVGLENFEEADHDFMAPDLDIGVDAWALQGVDMTLFDTIIRGVPEPPTDHTQAQQGAADLANARPRRLDAEIMFESWLGVP